MIIKFKMGIKMAETKYKTKQRDEILRFFMDNEDKCFTAREVCAGVKAGEATVFRTISSLVADGRLKRYSGGRGEGAYYQFNSCTAADHIHLKCLECGKLIHMDCSFMADVLDHFREHHGFIVNCEKTVIYGLCEACAEKNK